MEYQLPWVERKSLEVCIGKPQPWRGLRATSREDTGCTQYPAYTLQPTFFITREIKTPQGHPFSQVKLYPAKALSSCRLGLAHGELACMSVCVSVTPHGGLGACVDGGAADCGSSFTQHLSWGARALAERTATVPDPCGHLHSPRLMALHVLRIMQLGGP